LAESSQLALEETLWVALRMMEERKNLLSSLANHGDGHRTQQQLERVADIKHHINRLREFLLNDNGDVSPADAPAG
jgi:two-component system chemotaxis response regulator CheB